MGYFSVVGFRYVGAIGASDIWANFGVVVGSAAAIASLLLVLLIVFQISDQSGFNMVRWIADNSSALAIALAIISTIMLAFFVYKKLLFPLAVLMALSIILEIAVTYCNFIAYNRIMVWSAVLSIVYLIALSYFVGFYTGYFSMVLDTRRYDIYFDSKKVEGVRLVRVSSSGVIYAQGSEVAFANMGKITSIIPAAPQRVD